MNFSGKLVIVVQCFWKIEFEEILLVYDELDFLFGVVWFKFDGGYGGQNGLCDIICLLGYGRFYCLCIGIGYFGYKDCVVLWVFGCVGKDDDVLIGYVINDVIDVLLLVVKGDYSEVMKCLYILK